MQDINPSVYLDNMQALRRQGGEYVRKLREARGLSQRQFANLLQVKYYTYVSQIEIGRTRVPPDAYIRFASALDVDPKIFVQSLLRYYDPITYEILFNDLR